MTPHEEALLAQIEDRSLQRSLLSIREAVEGLWQTDVPRLVRDYTDHGIQHATRIAAFLTKILRANKGPELQSLELYTLLCGVYMHDVGMQCDPALHRDVANQAVDMGADPKLASPDFPAGAPTIEEQRLIRSNHQHLSAAWIDWSHRTGAGVLGVASKSIPDHVVRDVMDVCRYHTKLDISECPASFNHFTSLRKRLIAGLLRFCDELDIESNRVSKPGMIQEFAISPENAVYWWLHNKTIVDFPAENIVAIRIILQPDDFQNFGGSVRRQFIDHFQEKNRACLTVLEENLFPIVISPGSDVVAEPSTGAVPESIAGVLAGMGTSSEPASATGATGLPPTTAGAPRTSDLEFVQRLRLELENIGTSGGLIALLGLVDGLEAASAQPIAGMSTIRSVALDRLQEITADDPKTAGSVILGHVLPGCVLGNSSRHEDARYTAYLYRERLADWLCMYSGPDLDNIRHALLSSLVCGLYSSAIEQACWTIARLGFRTRPVVDVLRAVMYGHGPDTEDTVLATLIELGLTDDDRISALESVRRALADGHASVALWGALSRLRDVSTVPWIEESWLAAGTESEPRPEVSSALRILADIADANSQDADLQGRLWEITTRCADRSFDITSPQIYLGADISPRFDTADVVFYLVSLLSRNPGGSEEQQHRRDLLCRRLEECVRPRQLEAWSRLDAEHRRALHRLVEDTCMDTKVPVSSQTLAGLLKQQAWEILLRAGTSRLISTEYFEACVLGETNLTLRGEALEWLSCFRLNPLPQAAISWVADEFSATREQFASQYPVRVGSIRLLQSAGSRDSFDALLHFGFTYEGKILRDSVDALSDVSMHLWETDRNWVRGQILRTAVGATEYRHRSVAIGALHTLARYRRVRSIGFTRLVGLLEDPELTPFDRSEVIATIGLLRRSRVPGGIVQRLVQLARSGVEDPIQARSVEALARLGWLTNYPDIMLASLGLSQRDGAWHLSDPSTLSPESALVIGILYAADPSSFTPSFASALEADWETTYTALNILSTLHSSTRPKRIPQAIQDSVFARVLDTDSPWLPIDELIEVAAHLFPDAFARVDWPAVWDRWKEEPRARLADALASAQYSHHVARGRAVRHLIDLMRDAHYRVRRSAYRGLSALSYETFQRLSATWANAEEEALRRRAAETIVWYGADEDAQGAASQLHSLLRADAEPLVRRATDRAWDERRKNSWADRYLHLLTSMNEESNHSILQHWAYASALGRVGNDGSISELESFIKSRPLSPHLRTWLYRVVDALRNQWDETTKNWRESCPGWTGPLHLE